MSFWVVGRWSRDDHVVDLVLELLVAEAPYSSPARFQAAAAAARVHPIPAGSGSVSSHRPP